CHSHPSAQRILRLFTLLYPRPSRSTLFPYTTLFRSVLLHARTTRILRQAHGQFSATHVRTSFINKELLMLHSSSDAAVEAVDLRSEEHTSELQSRFDLVCRLLLEKTTSLKRCVLRCR